MKIYIVMGQEGRYDDFNEWVEKVFLDEKKAERWAENKGAQVEKKDVKKYGFGADKSYVVFGPFDVEE